MLVGLVCVLESHPRAFPNKMNVPITLVIERERENGSAELLASQAPQEEDDDDPDKVEDEEAPQEEDDDDPAKVEDEEASATEEGESEGKHEGAGADSGAGLPVLQASQEEDDDASDKVQDEEASATEEEESEGDNDRHFGYDPDREVDVCVEYQAAMQDPMFVY